MKTILALSAAVFAGALLASPAAAQQPYPADNLDPAYRHFLMSRSRVKSFSSLGTGRSWGYDTPLESARYWQTPGYYREQVSPRGHERFVDPPRVGGYVERRPVVVYPPVVGAPYPLPYPYPYPR